MSRLVFKRKMSIFSPNTIVSWNDISAESHRRSKTFKMSIFAENTRSNGTFWCDFCDLTLSKSQVKKGRSCIKGEAPKLFIDFWAICDFFTKNFFFTILGGIHTTCFWRVVGGFRSWNSVRRMSVSVLTKFQLIWSSSFSLGSDFIEISQHRFSVSNRIIGVKTAKIKGQHRSNVEFFGPLHSCLTLKSQFCSL